MTWAPKKVLIREEARHPVTKNVNSISLIRGEEEKNTNDKATSNDSIERPDGSDKEVPINEVEKENEAFNDSLLAAHVGKMKRKTYNLLSRGPIYKAILKKKITKKEDIGGNFEIPCNIGAIKEDEKRPFILGTPFLTTAKALIKFDKGTITLRSRKSKMSFHRIPESLYKIEKGIKNDIEPIAPTMTLNRLALEWEEGIKLHKEKEMEFDQWRSKIFKKKCPALVKVESEVKDEGEVT
ncbi:MAK10-like protein [Tanacetum coccineum]